MKILNSLNMALKEIKQSLVLAKQIQNDRIKELTLIDSDRNQKLLKELEDTKQQLKTCRIAFSKLHEAISIHSKDSSQFRAIIEESVKY